MSGHCNYYRYSQLQLFSGKAQELGVRGTSAAGSAADRRRCDIYCAGIFWVQFFAAPADGPYPRLACRFVHLDRNKQRYSYKDAENAHTVSYRYGRVRFCTGADTAVPILLDTRSINMQQLRLRSTPQAAFNFPAFIVQGSAD